MQGTETNNTFAKIHTLKRKEDTKTSNTTDIFSKTLFEMHH